MIEYLLNKKNAIDSKSIFYYYSITLDNYEMGLEVLHNYENSVMVTLYHYESESKEHWKKTGFYFPTNTEKTSFHTLYTNKKGKYFQYQGKRIYLPL